jgi:hypothetical protein
MFTSDQVSQLESFFAVDPYPKMKDRRHIASMMGIGERRVQVWFQNRRAKISRLKASEDERERNTSRVNGGERKMTTNSLDPADSSPQLPFCNVVRHCAKIAPKVTNRDEDEESYDNDHAFVHTGSKGVFNGVGFIQSVTTPFSNGVMYSSPVPLGGPRGSVSSPESDHLDPESVTYKDGLCLSLDEMLMRLNATESEAVRQLECFVDAQTKFLKDLLQTCESEFCNARE